MSRYNLTDFEWRVIEPPLPNKPRGIPRVDDRRVSSGILWGLRSGAPWRDWMPRGSRSGSAWHRVRPTTDQPHIPARLPRSAHRRSHRQGLWSRGHPQPDPRPSSPQCDCGSELM